MATSRDPDAHGVAPATNSSRSKPAALANTNTAGPSAIGQAYGYGPTPVGRYVIDTTNGITNIAAALGKRGQSLDSIVIDLACRTNGGRGQTPRDGAPVAR
jgi:hypothetical protein